jgi:hypothetical protein
VLTRERGWCRIEASYERTNLLSGGGLRNGQGNTKNGVGSQLALVGGTIELVQESVDSGLVLDVDVRRDQSGSNDVVDVANGLEDTLSTPLGLVTVAELDSLVLTGRGTGGDDGTVKASLGDDIDLDGGVTCASTTISVSTIKPHSITAPSGRGITYRESRRRSARGSW